MTRSYGDYLLRTPLTDEQVADLQRCMYVWVEIRSENGYDDNPFPIDIAKSCLLGRMTIAGKPPLPVPPPTSYSACWYNLIEDGESALAAHDVYGPYDGVNPYDSSNGGTFVSICQSLWRVLRVADPHGWVIIHAKHPENGQWVLRHLTKDDPPQEGGTMRLSDGSWAPFYLTKNDWFLQRLDTE